MPAADEQESIPPTVQLFSDDEEPETPAQKKSETEEVRSFSPQKLFFANFEKPPVLEAEIAAAPHEPDTETLVPSPLNWIPIVTILMAIISVFTVYTSIQVCF